jgi:hypothetical protein
MKKLSIVFSASIFIMCASSCDLQNEGALAGPDAALLADQSLAQEARGGTFKHDFNFGFDTAPVNSFETGMVIPKAFSKLMRMEDGISAVIHTSQLEPKGVYTVWMAVFENPEFCTDNICDLDDILDSGGNFLVNPDGTFGTPGVNVSLLWADGKVASAAGIATFTFKVKENNPPGEVLFGPGLMDTKGSEIHFALRNHGQAIPGLLEAQLTTFAGGCDINQCTDEQFALHLAE